MLYCTASGVEKSGLSRYPHKVEVARSNRAPGTIEMGIDGLRRRIPERLAW